MRKKKKHVLCLLASVMLFSILVGGQVREKGEISCSVMDEQGGPLPGATVILTGANLFQKSLSATTDASGNFRYAFLNQRAYAIEISLQGFDVLSLFNGQYYYRTITQPWRVYADGISAYGKPSSLFAPRNSRFNIAWRF